MAKGKFPSALFSKDPKAGAAGSTKKGGPPAKKAPSDIKKAAGMGQRKNQSPY